MSTSDLIQLGILIVSSIVGVVILWYTNETWKLRKEAQEQNDHAIMPIVMLERATDLPVREDSNMSSVKIVVRNVGLGPAFNIEIEPLKGPETEIRFHHTTSLAAGDRQPVLMDVHEGGKLVYSVAYGNIERMFLNRQLTTHSSAVIHYADVNGKKYRTHLRFHFDNITKELTLKLERAEPEPKG